MRRARAHVLGGAALLLAAACSPGTTAGDQPTTVETARGQANAVAQVPAVVAAEPSGAGSSARANSYAYVSESNRIVLFDQSRNRVAPDIELEAVPQHMAAGDGTLVLAFASGDLAAIEVITRRQTARASQAELRGRALGGDLILDEVQVLRTGVVVLAGRISDKASSDYRSFLQERDGQTLSLLREQVLPLSAGVVQDLTVEPTGSVRLLLSDGSVYDPAGGKVLEAGAGEHGQVLRHGPGTQRWIGGGDGRPGVLTPQDVFVPVTGRAADVVPIGPDLAAVLISQPPQVWLVTSAGEVLARTDVDDYPSSGAVVGNRLHVGSVNGDQLQVLDPASGAVQQRLRLGQGVLSVGTLRYR